MVVDISYTGIGSIYSKIIQFLPTINLFYRPLMKSSSFNALIIEIGWLVFSWRIFITNDKRYIKEI